MQKRGDKRGAVVVQLSWLSVFLVGVFILIFFIGFSSKQRALNEQIISAKMMANINTIFNTLKTSDRAYDKLVLPLEVDIMFDCQSNTFSIGDQSYPYPKDVIFFGPSTTTDTLIVMTNDWNKPFFVSNFMYLASDKKFIFLYPNQIYSEVKDFYDNIPDVVNKELLDINSGIENRDMNLVFFSEYHSNPDIISKLNSLTAKKIQAVELILKPQLARFYQKQGDIWIASPETHFYDEDTMKGALFSGSMENYQCAINIAMDGLHRATETLQLKMESVSVPRCQDTYDQIDSVLENLKIAEKPSMINKLRKDIEGYNANLEGESCPLLY
jgi:hypothetical protein